MDTTTALPNVQLPPGVHVHVQADTNDHIDYHGQKTVIAWTDRPYSTCPRCRKPITDKPHASPGSINISSGHVQPYNQHHGCGEWVGGAWEVVGEIGRAAEVTAEELSAAAERLANWLRTHNDDLHEQLREQLREQLEQALATPRMAGETEREWWARVQTGSETAPGVYHDGDELIAWDHDPNSEHGSLIEIHESDLDTH